MAKRNINAQDWSREIQLEIDRIAAGVSLAHGALDRIASGGDEKKLRDESQQKGLLDAWLQLEVTADQLQALREKIEEFTAVPRAVSHG